MRKSRAKPTGRRLWTKEEDTRLTNAVAEFGDNWKAVGEAVSTRTHTQCQQRWLKSLKPGLRKGHWGADEDAKLKGLVDSHVALLRASVGNVIGASDSNCDWMAIADQLGSRTSKQCRERWFNHLTSGIKRSPYSPVEDHRILELHDELGNQWTNIANDPNLAGRTEDMIKIRWRTLNR